MSYLYGRTPQILVKIFRVGKMRKIAVPLCSFPLRSFFIGMQFVSIAFAGAVPFVGTAAADELPPRKPGLWEIQSSMQGLSQKMPSAKQCVDASTDLEMRNLAQTGPGSACSKQETKKVGDTYVTDAVCNMGGSTITSHSVASGDFASGYHVEATSKMDPPMMGRGSTNVIVDAKYLGECPADLKPGDILMSNGQKMNISDIKNMAKGLMGTQPKSKPPVN